MPIRWRLTIWYAAFLVGSMILLGAGFYLGTRTLLFGFFEEQLEKQSALAQSSVHADSVTLTIDPNTVANLQDDEHFVRLLNANGASLVDTSSSVGSVTIDPHLASDALNGGSSVSSAETPEGTILIKTTPVRSGSAIVGVLQVGASRGDIEDVLRVLMIGLVIAVPVVLLLSAGGGYLLAGRALAPVAAITDLAANIGPKDLGRRLDIDLPDDELGRLSRTFDGMLSRIQDAFFRQRRFTGDAAHELRTPLAFMRSQVDLALSRPRSSDDYQEALREIDLDLERLTGLVSSLLTLARSDSGKLPVDPSDVDLAELISMTVEQYTPIARNEGIALTNTATLARAYVDSDLIVQLLVNLIDNAIAHTPCGGAIEVGSRIEGTQTRLWVDDSGPGIPPGDRERIFDRFYRVDTGRDRASGGAGLGLSICRAIVEAHDGTITAGASDLGGARFNVLLPGQASTPGTGTP
jgi:heavy metal sensor kinase